MKYRCTHCNHVFELSEREFQRCPNCFWTTSLVPVEGQSAEKEINQPGPAKMDRLKPSIQFPFRLFSLILIFGLLFSSAFILAQKGYFKNLIVKTPSLPLPPASDQISKSISDAERTLLSRPFEITIPRQVTPDEEEILKKQVTFPAKLGEKPVIRPWEKEDFENMLEAEQKKRQIQLGWNYERSLRQVFEKNYPAALKAFDQGDYMLARTHFMNSLSFPVYRGKSQLHRAVALVMLRPFINDVIGKIAVLNQYLVGQNYLSDVHSIFAAYQALFPVLELQEWDRALAMITDLKNQINTFEQKPKDQAVPLPPSFAALDPEIQNAIQAEASPKPEAAINLRAIMVDLNLKEKVVRSNTAEELSEIQKQYQRALSLIEQGQWEEARDLLRSIEFPPELVEDAKAKLEIIDKILALTHSDENQPNQQARS